MQGVERPLLFSFTLVRSPVSTQFHVGDSLRCCAVGRLEEDRAHKRTHKKRYTVTQKTGIVGLRNTARPRALGWMLNRVRTVLRDDRGAATAEYAVVIMAAVGFAGLLVVILRGDEVKGMLVDLVRNALGTAG